MRRALNGPCRAQLLCVLLVAVFELAAGQGNAAEEVEDIIDAYSRDRCGLVPQPLRNRKSNNRISNGTDIRLGQFPSFVNIQVQQGGVLGELLNCGGTIIGRRHIISAAHCFSIGHIHRIKVTSHIRGVRYAQHNDPEQVYDVVKICRASNFFDGAPDENGKLRSYTKNDVAIITLDRPLNYSDTLQPACLPTGRLTGLGSLVGMGLVGFFQPARVVQWTPMRTTTCARWLVHPSVMCLRRHAREHGRGCRGDSGGPFYLMDEEQRMVSVGGISFGSVRCAADERHVMLADYYNMRHEIRRLVEQCAQLPALDPEEDQHQLNGGAPTSGAGAF